MTCHPTCRGKPLSRGSHRPPTDTHSSRRAGVTKADKALQVRVEEFDEEDAYVLLTTRRSPESDDQQSVARRIVKALGLNPLGIELAAAAIAQVGYAEFAEQLEQTADDELEFAASLLSAAGESLPHREGGNLYLSRTLLASTRGLSEQGFDLLRLAAQVAVAPISRAVISRTFAATDSIEESQARQRTDLAVVELISRSLGRAAGPGGIEIHTLVSRVVRFHHSAPDRMRKLRGGALVSFFDQFGVVHDAQTASGACKRLIARTTTDRSLPSITRLRSGADSGQAARCSRTI